MAKALNGLGWAGRVFINLVVLAIILFAFTRTRDRLELRVIVSLMGLLYVAVRIEVWRTITTSLEVVTTVNQELKRIEALLRKDISESSAGELGEKARLNKRRMHVDMFFLALTGLICLIGLLMTYP